jgi:hypothetical protein
MRNNTLQFLGSRKLGVWYAKCDEKKAVGEISTLLTTNIPVV